MITRPSTEDIQKEYEDFLYIISHDFGAPLRHIRQFTQFLINDFEKKGLSEQNRIHADFLNESIERLFAMQDALLTLSRINSRAGEFKSCETNAIVTRAIENASKDMQSSPQITYGALPDITADDQQIETVFTELIKNACTFQTPDNTPEIHITAEQNDTHTIFEIRDNGIGIGTAYFDDVFQTFRQLHAQDAYPGVGAGLTIAQKIIHRHNGDIWVNPDKTALENGTTLTFILPRD